MTVDEVARAAGTTSRNVRNYQTKGLLDPPTMVGRVGHYGRAHLSRLKLIARLQERGYSLAAIGDLLRAFEEQQTVGEMLGLQRELTARVPDEQEQILGRTELVERFPMLHGNLELVASGPFDSGDPVVTPSRRNPDPVGRVNGAGSFLEASYVWTCENAGVAPWLLTLVPTWTCRTRVLAPDGMVRSDRDDECTTWVSQEALFTCRTPTPDEVGAWLDSISGRSATFVSNVIDIVSSAANELQITQREADALFNDSAFECGDDGSSSGVRVVCDSSPPRLMEGGLLRATMNLADTNPTGDTEHSYIYSLVLDSDGDPANDWQFVSPPA